jgi:hypothetical protein
MPFVASSDFCRCQAWLRCSAASTAPRLHRCHLLPFAMVTSSWSSNRCSHLSRPCNCNPDAKRCSMPRLSVACPVRLYINLAAARLCPRRAPKQHPPETPSFPSRQAHNGEAHRLPLIPSFPLTRVSSWSPCLPRSFVLPVGNQEAARPLASPSASSPSATPSPTPAS